MSYGCVQSPLTNVVLKTLPADKLSMGSGLDGIHRGFASAFGIALGSTILERRLTAHHLALADQQEAMTLSVQETARAITDTLTATGAAASEVAGQTLSTLWQHLYDNAQTAAYQDAFVILCVITVLACIPACMARERRDA